MYIDFLFYSILWLYTLIFMLGWALLVAPLTFIIFHLYYFIVFHNPIKSYKGKKGWFYTQTRSKRRRRSETKTTTSHYLCITGFNTKLLSMVVAVSGILRMRDTIKYDISGFNAIHGRGLYPNKAGGVIICIRKVCFKYM